MRKDAKKDGKKDAEKDGSRGNKICCCGCSTTDLDL
jgi:hypothetical protein